VSSVAADFAAEYKVGWPTLGDLLDQWLEQHARVPDKFHRGDPFHQSDWQFWCTANHYRVRADAEWRPEEPLLAQAFVYRRSQIMAPQKTGKGPWAAGIAAAEACGPVLFAGWAEAGDGYACSEHGCGCGWEYEYEPGEPMGMRHPSPLLQLTANSEDQVANVWRPLTAMIRLGPLSDLLLPREDFIRVAGLSNDEELDRIDKVTSNARSRLGNPISFALQDESGLWTSSNKMIEVGDAQMRGAAGMGGRTMETTNCYNPADDSQAQQTHESKRPDIFKYYRKPPDGLSYRNKEERRRIHRYVYFGSPWVDLDDIEGTAAELMERDPAQAERFFGNRIVAGSGVWLQLGVAGKRVAHLEIADRPKSEPICLGFDGSDVDDWTAIRAETMGQHNFTPRFGPQLRDGRARTIWDPREHDGRVPRQDVLAAFDELFRTFDVVRAYLDPPGWESQVTYLQGKYGEKRVIEFPTFKIGRMFPALERFRTDLLSPASPLRLDDDEDALRQFGHAIVRARPGQTYILGKPSQPQKIDVVMASVLAHEATSDAIAADDLGKRKIPQVSRTFYGFS
jgi:hypothetical protein